jgi:hypothetical protein
MNQNDCQYNPMPLLKLLLLITYGLPIYEFLEKTKKEIPLHLNIP